jgi:hypothetical protein
MNRASLIAVCIALVIPLAVGMSPSRACSQIVVSPENPTDADSLQVTISAYCGTFPAWIHSTSVELSEGLIKVIAEVECGMFEMPTLYTFSVMVPPRTPGNYTVEYWLTDISYWHLSTQILVLQAPIATGESTWGAIKSLFQ